MIAFISKTTINFFPQHNIIIISLLLNLIIYFILTVLTLLVKPKLFGLDKNTIYNFTKKYND